MGDEGIAGGPVYSILLRNIEMRLMFAFALMLFATFATPPAPTSAEPQKSAPEAADRTLGMAIMWARVDGAGNLIGSAGADYATYDNMTKLYTVTFDRPVEDCASSVTATSLAVPAAFESPDNGSVIVGFENSSGVRVQATFNLLVYCPR